MKHSVVKCVPSASPHHVEETEETSNQNLHLQWCKYNWIPYGNCKFRCHLTLQVSTRRVTAVVPRLWGGGRSCAGQVGQVKPHWKIPLHKGSCSLWCRQPRAIPGENTWVLLWVTRASDHQNFCPTKFRKDHCCLDVPQLNAPVQGLLIVSPLKLPTESLTTISAVEHKQKNTGQRWPSTYPQAIRNSCVSSERIHLVNSDAKSSYPKSNFSLHKTTHPARNTDERLGIKSSLQQYWHNSPKVHYWF